VWFLLSVGDSPSPILCNRFEKGQTRNELA
jgi:hypothetical protein